MTVSRTVFIKEGSQLKEIMFVKARKNYTNQQEQLGREIHMYKQLVIVYLLLLGRFKTCHRSDSGGGKTCFEKILFSV